MLIIGAGGLALQILDELVDIYGSELTFWSEYEPSPLIKENFLVLSNDEMVNGFFKKNNNDFFICVGNPSARKQLLNKFLNLRGNLRNFISKSAAISRFSTIENGAVILQDTIVEAGAIIRQNALINCKVAFTHDCVLGENSEIGPGSVICGRVSIGDNSQIGAGVTILPRVALGNNSIVGGGALVNKSFGDNCKIAGVPAMII